MANKIVVGLATLLVIVASAEALKCYNCGYLDGDIPDGFEIENSEESCRTGKTPKDEFSLDCANLTYVRYAEGKYVGVPKDSLFAAKNAVTISPLQANISVAYSCAKVTMDGKLVGADNKLKGTLRSCVILFNTTEQLPDKCYSNQNSKIIADIKEPAFAEAISRSGIQAYFSADSDAGACSCSTDDCNGAMNSANASVFVLLATTFLGYFSKFL